jgi:hypothetical protein
MRFMVSFPRNVVVERHERRLERSIARLSEAHRQTAQTDAAHHGPEASRKSMSASLVIRSLVAGAFIVVPIAVGPGSDDAQPEAAAWSGGSEAGESGGAPMAPGAIAERVTSSGDNEGLPFVVVDKPYAQLYVFDSRGELQALAPVAEDDGAVEKILADNRVIVYVLPETPAAANAVPPYIRYAARQ